MVQLTLMMAIGRCTCTHQQPPMPNLPTITKYNMGHGRVRCYGGYGMNGGGIGKWCRHSEDVIL